MSLMLQTDGYKLDHRRQYPEGTTRVYANWTPRKSRISGVDRVVFFGLQAFLRDFLGSPPSNLHQGYSEFVANYLGPNDIGDQHIRDLESLGYWPLRFCAVPEGTRVPIGVPMFTVENTHPDFAWLVNYLETALSASLWLPCTSATQADRMRRLLDGWCVGTDGAQPVVPFQAHDFSMRGMAGLEAACASGAGHLLSFDGTDTMPAIQWLQRHYGGQHVGASVPATEHSVMCAGGQDDEAETFRRILDLYPTGIVSVVSDTWDLWKVLTETMPALRDAIVARDGKLVIRPDSGNPADILCGTGGDTPAGKGVVELLWDVFGGSTSKHGYRSLHPCIGTIYGDAITYERADEICSRLAQKGFSSTNVVFGIGSYTYQYVTRDTFGFALKTTWCEVAGQGRDIFKKPITDSGEKFSARGRLAVTHDLELIQRATPAQEALSILQPVWEDGRFVRTQTVQDIRRILGVANA